MYLDESIKLPDQFWWQVDKTTRHEAVFATVQHIDQAQDSHRQSALHYLRLYSNRLASGLSGQNYALEDAGDRIKLNVIKSVIDAAAAQIATNRPRPMFLTTGGNRSQIMRAKNLNRFISGQFYAMDQYEVALKVFFDAAIFGTGYEHVFDECGRICGERVFPDEIIFDDTEARDCNPRQLFRHQEVDRAVLSELYPSKRGEIQDAGLIRDDSSYRSAQADRCSVVQAWHLPSSKDAGDGKMVVAVDKAVLLEQPWTRDTFPIVPFRIADAPLGFRGIGFAEELTSIQVEINYIAQKLQALMNLAPTLVIAHCFQKIMSSACPDPRKSTTESRTASTVPGLFARYVDPMMRTISATATPVCPTRIATISHRRIRASFASIWKRANSNWSFRWPT